MSHGEHGEHGAIKGESPIPFINPVSPVFPVVDSLPHTQARTKICSEQFPLASRSLNR